MRGPFFTHVALAHALGSSANALVAGTDDALQAIWHGAEAERPRHAALGFMDENPRDWPLPLA